MFAANPCGNGGNTHGFHEGNTCAAGGGQSADDFFESPEFRVLMEGGQSEQAFERAKAAFLDHKNKGIPKTGEMPKPPPEKWVSHTGKVTYEDVDTGKEVPPPEPKEKKSKYVKTMSPEEERAWGERDTRLKMEAALRLMSPAQKKSFKRAIAIGKRHGVEVVWMGADAIIGMFSKIGRDPGDTVAIYSRMRNKKTGKLETRIYLNHRNPFWVNPERNQEAAFKRNWFSSPGEDHQIHHEVAHSLHFDLVGEKRYEELKAMTIGGALKQGIQQKVGRYAASNALEFVAEVYAAHKSGRKFPPDVYWLYEKFQGPPLESTEKPEDFSMSELLEILL